MKEVIAKWINRFNEFIRRNSLGTLEHENTFSRTLAATIAKWLIPSVSAIFIVVGYVVVQAQQNLLGVDLDNGGTSGYIIATAGFLRDICTFIPLMLIQIVTGEYSFTVDASERVLFIAILMPSRILLPGDRQ
jgi:hypothetical protein